MKRSLTIGMIVVFVLTLFFVFPADAWADGDISIQNHQKYIGDDGALHIVGEIQNNLDAPLNQIDIKATLLSSDRKEIDVKSTNALLNRIMPGMKGPFDLIISGDKANKVEDYFLEIHSYKVVEPKNQVIEIRSSELERDNFDNLWITGTVVNRGEITANTVVVVATLYDRDGNVAAVSKTQPEPDYLRANDETFFFVSVPDKLQGNSVVDYSLVAESEEYAAVPEFPLGTTALLALSVFAYVILTRYYTSKKVIANLVSA